MPSHLHIIIGPMWSGKTTELLRIYNNYNDAKIKPFIINHSFDSRVEDSLKTHKTLDVSDDSTVQQEPSNKSVKLKLLSDIYESECLSDFLKAHFIMIDEAQFFSDLYDFVFRHLENGNKTFYVFGLDGDFRRNIFGEIYRLIPLADSIKKLTGYCMVCNDGTPGIFTKKITSDASLIDIGCDDKYQLVCRRHYTDNVV